MSIPVDGALTAYVNIRNNLATKESEFKKWKKEQEDAMEKLALFLKTTCTRLGTDSVKANGIIAFQKTKDSVAIEDKDLFKGVIAKGIVEAINNSQWRDDGDTELLIEAIAGADIFDLLTLSANKTNCKAYMESNEGLMPLGIKYYSEKVIQVRKGK